MKNESDSFKTTLYETLSSKLNMEEQSMNNVMQGVEGIELMLKSEIASIEQSFMALIEDQQIQ